ncbi:hypothetical protein AB0N81_09420 [Streptomyces sp. NPDC093510]|uniref:hypothetical protein n=1 Tax=Streptomyces sp. NPDC093510 TaxID=3155199 RepID=UPI00341906FE
MADVPPPQRPDPASASTGTPAAAPRTGGAPDRGPDSGGDSRLRWIIGTVVAVLGIVLAVLTYYDSHRTTESDLDDKASAEKQEKGPALEVTGGFSWYGPAWYASRSDRISFKDRYSEDTVWELFRPSKVTPVGKTGTSIVVESRHPTTVTVHGVQVRDRHCEAPLDGSALSPPGIGDGGSDAPPVRMGINLDSGRPVTRDITDDEGLGGPFSKQFTLDQGDAQEIQVSFRTERQTCAFRADLLVTSQGKRHTIPIPVDAPVDDATTDRSTGDAAEPDYTFRVTAPAPRYARAYRSVRVGDDTRIDWAVKEIDAKDLTPDGTELSYSPDSATAAP